MTLRRLTMMAIGFIAASCVAACIIVIALLLFTSSLRPFAVDAELVRTSAFLTALIAAFVAVLALFPFLVAVVYAERKAITTATWYVVAGAGAGVLAFGLNLLLTAPRGGISLSDLSDHPVFTTLSSVATVAAVAGICAGYTYWLIAVRRYRKKPA